MSVRIGSFLRDSRDAVIALRLLVLAGLSMLGLTQAPEFATAFWITTIVYGLTNLGYMISGVTTFLSARVQTLVFVFDVVVVSALIVMRGANVPELILAYFTLVLMAAVVQGVGTAFLNALVVCTVFAAVSMWGADQETLLGFPVLAQFAFFFVVSIFMSQLAESGREYARARARAELERSRLSETVEDRTRDLTRSVEELESARARLASADRMATIGTLAAGVAHDIRNPVAALRAALDEAPSLLDEMGASNDRTSKVDPGALLRSSVDDAREACDHLQRLAGDLTAAARSTPAKRVPVSCREAVEAAARLLRHRAKAPLSIEVDARTETAVLADPGRLQQVLLNLGANGLDAMEGRAGVLILATEEGATGFVRFRVEDTGIGMSDAVAAKALQGFYTTKPTGKGTGLGLYLVREIVQTHGARIELVSKPGLGTTFLIEWPTATPHGAQEGVEEHERVEDGGADRGRRGEHSPRAGSHAPA